MSGTAETEAQAEAPATEAVETPSEAEPAPDEETAETPEPVLPSFDTVRVEADGSVLVAGRAGIGAAVSILLDEVEAATAEADGKGAFASLFTLDPSDAPRVMTLIVTTADGAQIPSEDSVVIGPVAAPKLVAAADPEPAPEPVAEETGADEVAAATDEPAAEEAAPEVMAEAEPAAPEVLIIDNDGVRLQTEAGPVADILIDTIGYGATGDVEMAGRGTAGQFARLYLDNADTAVVGIGQDGGWSAVLTDVAPGLYTLRVDQMDGTGMVTSRFETPFQREAPDTVVAALQSDAPATEPADTTSEPDLAAPDTAATSTPETVAAPEPDSLPEAGTTEVAAAVATEDATTAIASAPAADPAPKPATRAAIVTVQPGFSLWRIARENYGDGVLYVKVFEANKDLIRNPDLIYPGQIFTIPDPAE
ncbi:MAG: LysM peptidoglycan-binding domain-containing protein [Albidovulum sp.]|uniref:LysM peptidoglycan-binding domain-containing protein n=1 Tax=Albidovulum sp. TaxID=1872424 RepID=UPI003CB7FCD5